MSMYDCFNALLEQKGNKSHQRKDKDDKDSNKRKPDYFVWQDGDIKFLDGDNENDDDNDDDKGEEKHNPYHDAVGRFASSDGAATIVHADGTREKGPAHPDNAGGGGSGSSDGGDGGNGSDDRNFDDLSHDEKDALLAKQSEEWQKSLTDDEKAVVKDYAEEGYREINGELRGNDPSDDPMGTMQKTKNLNNALNKASLAQEMTVVRGMDAKGYSASYFANNIGKDFQDMGFASTSMSKSSAESFLENGVLMNITVPKGYPAAYMHNISSYGNEGELLLQRGTKFKIDGVSKNEDGVSVVHLSVQSKAKKSINQIMNINTYFNILSYGRRY